jgi:alpha-galactosidase
MMNRQTATIGGFRQLMQHAGFAFFLTLLFGVTALGQAPSSAAKDISGTWIAEMQSPGGDSEIVYEFKVENGKITGTQRLPFGDSPIIDGKIEGNHFEFTVQTESFGKLNDQVVAGEIVGDELKIAVTMPGPPEGGDSAAPGAGGGPGGAGEQPAGGAPGAGGPPGGPGGPMAGMKDTTVTVHRGTPRPSYKAASVNYKTLPKAELPAVKELSPNGLAKTPPMGWNSWNKFQTKIDDKTVRGIADAIASNGMKDAGYKYIVIDDGWEWKRDEKGSIVPNPNFPDMKALADYLHSKGLKLGIYSSPGPLTCAGYEGSYGHEKQDAETYAAWGIDYLKYDWCSASRVYQETDMRAAYQKMGEALQKTGRPIVYALCQYGREHVEQWGPSVAANLWRTTGDISDRYQSMMSNGTAEAELAPYAAPGHWNDPDMLEIGNGGMSATEYQTHFSFWAILAAPLLAGNDVRALDDATRKILLNKEVIAVDQDALGKQGHRIARDGETEVWAKPLTNGAVAVALFNRGSSESEVRIKWADLQLNGKLKVRDLWAHADLGANGDGFTSKVASHGVVLLRVSK